MGLVNNITEDVEQMPLAVIIFKDKDSDEVIFSKHSR